MRILLFFLLAIGASACNKAEMDLCNTLQYYKPSSEFISYFFSDERPCILTFSSGADSLVIGYNLNQRLDVGYLSSPVSVPACRKDIFIVFDMHLYKGELDFPFGQINFVNDPTTMADLMYSDDQKFNVAYNFNEFNSWNMPVIMMDSLSINGSIYVDIVKISTLDASVSLYFSKHNGLIRIDKNQSLPIIYELISKSPI